MAFQEGVHDGWDFDGSGDGTTDPTAAGYGTRRLPDISGSCALTGAVLLSGTVAGTARKDVLFYFNSLNETTGEVAEGYFMEQGTLSSGIPTWTLNDLDNITGTASPWPFDSPSWSWHWRTSSVAQLFDWDNDGLDDLLVVSSRTKSAGSTGVYDEIFIFENQGGADDEVYDDQPKAIIGSVQLTDPFAGDSAAAPGSDGCLPGVSRGATVMLHEDFDGDGDIDVVVGAMNEEDLLFFDSAKGDRVVNITPDDSPTADEYKQFNTPEVIDFPEGGPTYGVTADFNGDGYPDILIARDEDACDPMSLNATNAGGGARMALFLQSFRPTQLHSAGRASGKSRSRYRLGRDFGYRR